MASPGRRQVQTLKAVKPKTHCGMGPPIEEAQLAGHWNRSPEKRFHPSGSLIAPCSPASQSLP
jgi:hypothetical protein